MRDDTSKFSSWCVRTIRAGRRAGLPRIAAKRPFRGACRRFQGAMYVKAPL